eukprot:GFKZ01003050.1.p2 GENE.GFKZ01003050.1~~GFKZ01003050.1.p2  ORF type:complete len:119 (-),score=4.44 GFKZ01003050.1:617-973(-)
MMRPLHPDPKGLTLLSSGLTPPLTADAPNPAQPHWTLPRSESTGPTMNFAQLWTSRCATAIDIYVQLGVIQDISRYIASRGTAPASEHGNLRIQVSAYVQMYTARMISNWRLSHGPLP